MNLVVIGGGRPQHFGRDLVVRARSQGHDVRVISHRNYGTGHPHDQHADFDTANEPVLTAFQTVTQDLEHIDLLLYNTVSGSGPWDPQDFTTQAREFTTEEWMYNLRINVMLPYQLTIQALKKMNHASNIVYMTTGRSVNPEDAAAPYIASYYGGKAWANHVMKSFSHYNDRSATCLSVTSHFDYGNPQAYAEVFDRAYDYILHGIQPRRDNGRIITIQ